MVKPATPGMSATRRSRMRTKTKEGGGHNRLDFTWTGGNVFDEGATKRRCFYRYYVPGLQEGPGADGGARAVGMSIASHYSSGVFRPGTHIRWEPAVSFNTSGRVIVGFTDNPEAVETLSALANLADSGDASAYQSFISLVRALQNNISFPVWQETNIKFPTHTRRKNFDVDNGPIVTIRDSETRMQMAMFAVVTGYTGTNTFGAFYYRDVLDVYHMQPRLTDSALPLALKQSKNTQEVLQVQPQQATDSVRDATAAGNRPIE